MLTKLKKWLIAIFLGSTALAATVALQPTEYSTINEVITAEESYYKQNGKYLQVLQGSKLPHYEQGTVKDKLGKDIPQGFIIDVYEFEGKRGYQIRYEDANTFYSVATGTEKTDRTWIKNKPPVSNMEIMATTTTI